MCAFEEAAFEQYGAGKAHGTMHLCIGQEATAIGAIAALRVDDLITSTHRGHGHAIGKGQSVNDMMAELLGKETGVCHGRGGSMHMVDLTLGSWCQRHRLGRHPIGRRRRAEHETSGQRPLVACFFGDGAVNNGNFHESLNMAAIWNLPVLFLCENNHYAMSMAVSRGHAVPRVADRAMAYGIPGHTVDGMDVTGCLPGGAGSRRPCVRGEGPALLELVTYRYRGHSKSDKQVYRTL